MRETEKEYAVEDWKTFVLREPDTFMGSGTMETCMERIYDPHRDLIELLPVVTSHAMKHTFTEALSNAQDSIMRAKMESLPAEYVRVKFLNNRRVEITNVGADIISVQKNQAGVWIPETVLGNLLSGSNSKAKNKTWIGKNGVGGTLVNIFSKSFSVEVWDHVRELYYRQTWSNNCVKEGEPLIIPGGKGEFEYSDTIPETCGAVKVVFELDFDKFTNEEFRQSNPDHSYTRGEYCDEVLRLYCRKVIDCSLATGVPAHLLWTDGEGQLVMDKTFNITDIEQYSEKFFTSKPGNFLVYRPAFPATWRPLQGEGVLSEIQAVIYDTPDEGFGFSFVNGQPTEYGGVHVDEICKTLCQYVITLIEEETKIHEGVKLTQMDIMSHMSVFVNAVVPDPKFTGQTKSKLTSPKPAIRWYTSDIEKIKTWSLVVAAKDTVEAKKRRLLSRSDGKKIRRVNIPKAEDANNAGGPESDKCVLWFCEGESAKNYALTLLETLEGGRNYNGIYPLSGKFLNVMKANVEKMRKNKQVIEIKALMGLQEAVDYTKLENLRQLRYGKVGVLTDQDMDGSHIKYLLTVFFGARFVGVLMGERMITWLSPIIRARRGKQCFRFFSMADFHLWKNDKPPSEMKKWTIKYYKGLGSSTDEEVREDAGDPYVEVSVYDDRASDSLELAFSTSKIKERKIWINDFIRSEREGIKEDIDRGDRVTGFTFEPAEETLDRFLHGDISEIPRKGKSRMFTRETKTEDSAQKLMLEKKPITAGIHSDYMHYSLLTLKRAIPSDVDGLKVSERKVIWTALRLLKDGQEIKTAQFGNLTAKETDYAHNEQCLEKVISALAQDFPTSNNLPHFKGNGQFGSRYLPKASSGRYTHVEKAFWLRYVYREEDDNILPMVFDEGRETEPEHLVPIIPMVLVNGTCGIANGFSTFTPQYNPLDIVAELKRIIRKEPGDASFLPPWYRGYNGTIDLIVEDSEERRVMAMQTYGCYEELKGGNARVTELPIGLYGEDYRKKLNEWRENRATVRRQALPGEQVDTRSIKDFNNLSKKNVMDFEIYGIDDMSYQSLGLVKKYGLTNMTLLEPLNTTVYDSRDKKTIKGPTLEPYIPRKYNSIEEYLQQFVRVRLYYYSIRKNYLISEKRRELAALVAKRRFIDDVLTKTVDVFSWDEERILAKMAELGHPESLYTQTPIRRFSPAEVEKLGGEIRTAENILTTLTSTDIETMWLRDLSEFEDAYLKMYKKENTARAVSARPKIKLVRVKKGAVAGEDDLAEFARVKDVEREDTEEGEDQ